jgi:8-oxo-dGTP pyrophosphatase MutT (NUDIX family)
MSAHEWRLAHGGSKVRPLRSSKFVSPSQLRAMRGREQVAAVCYRLRNRKIEFLLVQTRGGRWTFPKGSAEPGLTHAQAAALEAFEEAGVHGRMEEASFAHYTRRKGGAEVVVNAHLCEVLWLGPPQEANRNPSWFPTEKAKRKLREDRNGTDASEFSRVVDRALTRIQKQRRLFPVTIDAMQKVQFTLDRLKSSTAGKGPYLIRRKDHSGR